MEVVPAAGRAADESARDGVDYLTIRSHLLHLTHDLSRFKTIFDVKRPGDGEPVRSVTSMCRVDQTEIERTFGSLGTSKRILTDVLRSAFHFRFVL